MARHAHTAGRGVIGAAVGVAIGIGIVAVAGDVNPPAGPVTGTMKTLVDVEPRVALRNDPAGLAPVVITQRGSYYLAEDIYALQNQHGIEITTDDVSLDLNGFAIIGNVELGSLNGVHLNETFTPSNVRVRNGVIRAFQGTAISAGQSAGAVVERVRVSNCGSGIIVGINSVVSDCMVRNCSGNGVFVNSGSLARGCVSSSNGNVGIVNDNGLVHGCAARGNSVQDYIGIGGASAHDNQWQ